MNIVYMINLTTVTQCVRIRLDKLLLIPNIYHSTNRSLLVYISRLHSPLKFILKTSEN